MGMMGRMEREKRNRERRKQAKGERVEVDRRRGDGVADSNVASDGSMVMGVRVEEKEEMQF